MDEMGCKCGCNCSCSAGAVCICTRGDYITRLEERAEKAEKLARRRAGAIRKLTKALKEAEASHRVVVRRAARA